MNEQKQKKHTLLYLLIIILLAGLIFLAGLTCVSMYKMSAIQKEFSEVYGEINEVNKTVNALLTRAEELEALTNASSSEKQAEAIGPEPPPVTPTPAVDSKTTKTTEPTETPAQPSIETPQEEGMISPSKDAEGTFSSSDDDSMNQLLAQVQNLLPTNNGTWSVYVCNLIKGTEGAIHDTPMQAASLIKLFIMGAVYENYDNLTIQYGSSSVDSLLYSMITVSDNDAANTLVSYLGGGDTTSGMYVVNSFCKAHGYLSTSMGRLLLQSNANGDNYTSVSDCGKFLKEIYQINNGTAVSATLSHAQDMYHLLKNQTRLHKIPAQMPAGVGVANKTGELSSVENDAAIIFDTAKGIDLVICFMSENLTATGSAQQCIAEYSRMIYGYYNE